SGQSIVRVEGRGGASHFVYAAHCGSDAAVRGLSFPDGVAECGARDQRKRSAAGRGDLKLEDVALTARRIFLDTENTWWRKQNRHEEPGPGTRFSTYRY